MIAVFAVVDGISVDIIIVFAGELVVLIKVESKVNSGEEDVLKIEGIPVVLLIIPIVVPL